MANLPGGFGEMMDATEETQKICDEVKCKVEEKTNKKYAEFKAVKYREQIVTGTNFLISVHVGGESYLQLLVFQALPCHGGGVELRTVQMPKTKHDPLEQA